MAELSPLPLSVHLRRIFSEFRQEGTIYHLPQRAFFRPDGVHDISVRFHGARAATPVGPAAGPQSQLAQNLVLAWLGGSRLIELKTVQINDRLKIPRPCIHVPNIGYNVEWSQELRLSDSLREYIRGMMLIEILKEENVCGFENPKRAGETLFDVSVGYDKKGIESEAVTGWLRSVKDASRIIEELREEIPAEFARFKGIDFPTKLSDSVTLSTFHGCPADEIEGICEYLMGELGFHVVVKMNPPMLGREKLEYLLYERLGYTDVEVNPAAYTSGIAFSEAVAMCRRLEGFAAARGLGFGVKFSNTLEVKNKGDFLPESEKVQYLSGQPLYVLAMHLVQAWREEFPSMPVSFSAGIDQHNFAEAVACGLLPVTTCTDLLRPGGYGRLHKYLLNLQKEMQARSASTIEDFIIRYSDAGKEAASAWRAQVSGAADIRGYLSGQRGPEHEALRARALDEVAEALQTGTPPLRQAVSGPLRSYLRLAETQVPSPESVSGLADAIVRSVAGRAAVLNTPGVVEKILQNPRYARPKNKSVPKKIGRSLTLYDCINCDKCVPVCPNDANFFYEIEPRDVETEVITFKEGVLTRAPGVRFSVEESHQLANYADFCNECGNCDVFCPEDGGPYIQKPRFFGSRESFLEDKKQQGFFVFRAEGALHIQGRVSGREYHLALTDEKATFSDGKITAELDPRSHNLRSVSAVSDTPEGHSLDLRYYHAFSLLLEGVLARPNFVSAGNGQRAMGNGKEARSS